MRYDAVIDVLRLLKFTFPYEHQCPAFSYSLAVLVQMFICIGPGQFVWLNLGFLPKVILPYFVNQSVGLVAFSIPCCAQYMRYNVIWTRWQPSDFRTNCLFSLREDIGSTLGYHHNLDVFWM